MDKIVVCNTGTTGKSHARWVDQSITLCGKDVITPNKGDEDMDLLDVQCKHCLNSIYRKQIIS